MICARTHERANNGGLRRGDVDEADVGNARLPSPRVHSHVPIVHPHLNRRIRPGVLPKIRSDVAKMDAPEENSRDVAWGVDVHLYLEGPGRATLVVTNRAVLK